MCATYLSLSPWRSDSRYKGKMSSEGREAAAAGARAGAFGAALLKILGEPKFAIIALSTIRARLLFSEENWKRLRDSNRAELSREEMRAFDAFLGLVCNLADSNTKLKPEELAGDAAIWDRLTSEVGIDAAVVETLRAYAAPSCLPHQQLEKVEGKNSAHLSFTDIPFLGEAHKHLYQHLQERCEEANIHRHYSPYVAVVQASGVGKSRAVMQLSELGVYICYCSLAGEYSSASPPRTGRLAGRLSSTRAESDMVLYFKAWLKVLNDSLSKDGGVSADYWKEQQLPTEGGSPRGDVAERVCDEWERLLAIKDPSLSERKLQDDLCKTEVAAIRHHLKGSCTVLFVFDEARGLQEADPNTGLMSTSPFYQVTRVLRCFFNQKAFFAVFLDTAARVSNLVPDRKNDDSRRALAPGRHLLKPIYCLPNMCLHRPRPELNAEEYWNPEKWLSYGRPLWAARWKYNSSIKTMLAFAQQKLLGNTEGDFDGKEVDVVEGIMTRSQAITLLSAATGLSICARSMLAERLAASHMNLILRVTGEFKERRIYVGLSAEPILAEAAGSVLETSKVQAAALKHLDEAYLAGYVTPGPRGEFVSKFILVAAVWKLKKGDVILRPIPVDQFLETLLSGDADKLKGMKEKIPEKGIVFFNSFVLIRRAPVTANLGKAFAAGHALMYRAENRLPGADIIIPVWTPKGMTALVVSVKNMQNAGWLPKESVDKLKSKYTQVVVAEGLTTVTLLMSLREPQMKDCENWDCWDFSSDNHVHLTCYGIDRNYSFLDKEVKASLKKLLVTVPDELSDATDSEKSCIQNMLPEQFEPPDSKFTLIPSGEVAAASKSQAKRKGDSSAPQAAKMQRKGE